MCKYCEKLDEYGCGANIIYDGSWTDLFHLWKDEKCGYRIECHDNQSSPIKFCPMCGKPIQGATQFDDEPPITFERTTYAPFPY